MVFFRESGWRPMSNFTGIAVQTNYLHLGKSMYILHQSLVNSFCSRAESFKSHYTSTHQVGGWSTLRESRTHQEVRSTGKITSHFSISQKNQLKNAAGRLYHETYRNSLTALNMHNISNCCLNMPNDNFQTRVSC